MPCDSIRLYQVELKLADREILKEALARAGLAVVGESAYGLTVKDSKTGMTYTLANGRLQGQRGASQRDVGAVADRIKQAYTRETIHVAAQRFGWDEQEVESDDVVLTRRSGDDE